MNDLISRQAAIEAIKTWGLLDGLSEGQAIEILADEKKLPPVQPEVLAHGEGELIAQPEPTWIPISKETNPKKSGWYLVTVHEDATIENKRFTGMAEFNATNGMWYDIEEPTDMYLRWMPLPEPYAER